MIAIIRSSLISNHLYHTYLDPYLGTAGTLIRSNFAATFAQADVIDIIVYVVFHFADVMSALVPFLFQYADRRCVDPTPVLSAPTLVQWLAQNRLRLR